MAFKRGPEFQIENEPVEIRLWYAKNPETHPELLRHLSKDSFWFVRDYVASNPSTPEECLRVLVEDKDFRIRVDAEKTLKKSKEQHPSLTKIIAAANSYQGAYKPNPFDPSSSRGER